MSQTEFYVYFGIVILLSLTIHEYSHGRVAFMLGDDTAARQGRLTLNPIKHLDPLGTISFFFIHFGWGKPVPVDSRNFENPQRDMMYVAAAGPASNLVLALVVSFIIRMMGPESLNPKVFVMLCIALQINILLAIFNLLPVFPLDGGSILKGLVPLKVALQLGRLDRYMGLMHLGVILLAAFATTGNFGSILRLPLAVMVEFFSQEAFPYVNQVLRLQ